MRSLRYLSVSKLLRRSLRSEDFLEFGVELEDLKIYRQHHQQNRGSAFEHVRSIKTLDMSENNIEFIDPFAFAEACRFDSLRTALVTQSHQEHNREVFGSMLMLQYLDLSHNQIFDLEYDCFKKVKNLQIVDMSHNHIIEIPVEIFQEMQTLSSVDLSDNHIRQLADNLIPSSALERCSRKLVEFDLSGNNIPAVAIADLVLRFRSGEGEYWQEEPDYNDEYMYHTARRDHQKVFHQKKQYPQNILYKATHTLNELRWLSLSGNPITALMNTSLYGVSPRLEYLDVTRLRIKIFETGAFSKMYALRTLKITAYSNARDFNVPRMLTNNAGLENLYIDVDDSSINLGKEMNGQLPCKLDNITITGRAMRFLSEYLLNGVHSKKLRLTIFTQVLRKSTRRYSGSQDGYWRDLDCGFGRGFLNSPNIMIMIVMSLLTALYI
ncbi:unnamed protein product, partial [Plutella xylostella]